MRELILKDDMGTGNYLKILQEDDGDIIISIIKEDNRFNTVPEVQFCASGSVNPGVALFFNKLIGVYKEKSYYWLCPTCKYNLNHKPKGVECQELCPNCRHKFLGDFIEVKNEKY